MLCLFQLNLMFEIVEVELINCKRDKDIQTQVILG